MPYKINDTLLVINPTTGRWIPRDAVGIDGGGHPVYSAVREFEMRWDLLGMAEFSALMNFYQQVATGSSVVCQLPKLGASTWTYYDYSGCTLHEPEADVYFAEHATSVLMLISNIHTVGTE